MKYEDICNKILLINVQIKVEISNLFYPELELINTKPVIIKKLKEQLNELNKFKVEITLVLDCKKRNDYKIFRSCAKLVAGNSDMDEAFKSMHQNIMRKIKIYAREDSIVLDVIIKHQY